MPDKLLREGICTSGRVGAVSEGAENLFYRLLVRSCALGRYHADPAIIKATAYTNRPRIRLTDVASRLDELEAAGLILRYTAPADNTPLLWIPRLGQKFKFATRSPYPAPPAGPVDAPGQGFMPWADPGPPPGPPIQKEKRREEKARGSARETRPHSTTERAAPAAAAMQPEQSEADWIAQLRRDWPTVKIDAELAAAQRKLAKEGRQLTREYFREHWLPNVGTPVAAGTDKPKAATKETSHAPDDWQEILAELYPPELVANTRHILDGGRWTDVPEPIRRAILARAMERQTV
jgi:hypothetical protein